jgi:DnaJ-class molecular chaperone
MHAIARVMEGKVRFHLMGIEDFGTSMKAYIAIEDKSGAQQTSNYDGRDHVSGMTADEQVKYVVLGVSPLASNDEIKKVYLSKMKTFHPDMALSEEAKKEFEKRCAEINEAYSIIKKQRGIT